MIIMEGKMKNMKKMERDLSIISEPSTVGVISFEMHFVSYVIRLSSTSVGCAKG